MAIDNQLPHIGFNKILYVTDLSESGRQAFPYAASIAQKFGAELTVFHVVEAHDFEKYLVGYISEEMWEEIKHRNLDEARQMLIDRKRGDTAIKDSVEQQCVEAMESEGRPIVAYDVAVEIGEPVDVIVHKAEQEDYDLVVISKHGHGALKGALIGDTATRVVRRCHKPVMVVEVPPKED